MVRKNIKRPRLNSRKKRKLRYDAEHPRDAEGLLPSVPDTAAELEVLLLEGIASGEAVEADLGGHPAG